MIEERFVLTVRARWNKWIAKAINVLTKEEVIIELVLFNGPVDQNHIWMINK